MDVQIKIASADDAAVVAELVMELTAEISLRCGDKMLFHRDTTLSTALCARWIAEQCYTALIMYAQDQPIGVATVAASYALYAGGKVGIIQEFYVVPAHRDHGAGSELIEAVLALAPQRGWACVELCTPPLPQFEPSLHFYQKHAFKPVGGRKMRRTCPPAA